MSQPKTALSVPRRARWLAWLALLPLAAAANDDGFSVRAECRNGIAHGRYRVESGQGRLRIEGGYAEGRREGEFVFYAADGARLIVLPYAQGLLHGTVRAWYAASNNEPGALKLVSDLSAGFAQGRYQTWYENGNRRSDFIIENGEITAGRTWQADGSVLEIGDVPAFLQADIESDFAYYGRLEQVMDAYPPACAP